MTESHVTTQTPLEAKSPFDLRVDLGKDVPETDVRSALAQGDMGFMHSFTTGSAVDGPGVRVVGWTSGCMRSPQGVPDAEGPASGRHCLVTETIDHPATSRQERPRVRTIRLDVE